MALHPASETVQSIRETLQTLEQNLGSAADQPDFGDLKRILLNRIADLEPVGVAVEEPNLEVAVQGNSLDSMPSIELET